MCSKSPVTINHSPAHVSVAVIRSSVRITSTLTLHGMVGGSIRGEGLPLPQSIIKSGGVTPEDGFSLCNGSPLHRFLLFCHSTNTMTMMPLLPTWYTWATASSAEYTCSSNHRAQITLEAQIALQRISDPQRIADQRRIAPSQRRAVYFPCDVICTRTACSERTLHS